MRSLRLSAQNSCYRRALSWLALVAIIVSFGVSFGGCNDSPPTRKQIGAVAATPAPNVTSSPATTDDLVIYLDTSGSMQGYVSSEGSSVFSRTLRSLRDFATTLNPPVNVHMRTVDATVGAPQSDVEVATASINRSIYRGSETNLAAAIGSFTEAIRPIGTASPNASPPHSAQTAHLTPAAAAQNQPAPPAPPARFHILATDGVQYARKQSTDLSCASGSDPVCVRKKILGLLAQGWGGSVIGLRSQFCCAFHSETAQKPVAYRTEGRRAQEFRPFYLYVFSPDRAALGQLVAKLKESLRKAINDQDLVLRELALTQDYAGRTLRAECSAGNRRQASCRQADSGAPRFFSMRLNVDAKAAAQPFTLTLDVPWSQHALDSGSKQELAELLQWELTAVYPTKEHAKSRYPVVELVKDKPQTDGEGRIVLRAAAHWPPASGKPEWRAYRLIGRLNQETDTPVWVREWSTDLDTASSTGNKTLYLNNTLLGVWRNPSLKDQVVAEVYLRVGPAN